MERGVRMLWFLRLFFCAVLLQGASSVVFGVDLPPKTAWEEMWSIQLVNHNHLIKGEVDISFVSFDGQQVDARAGQFYKEMVAHAKSDGITLYLRSGYRSISTQKVLISSAIERYMGYGYSYSKAVEIADRYYAKPAGSEHNIGLAFDIITPEYHQTVYSLDSRFAQTKAYEWLMLHCAEHGFILRYPEGRTAETGINFEPWHFRYVGKEHAEYIMNHGLILEEYVALYQETYPELYGDSPPPEENPYVSTLVGVDWENVSLLYQALSEVYPEGFPVVEPEALVAKVEEFVEDLPEKMSKVFSGLATASALLW